ncbi:hypothetical protein [Paenibacillus silvisoli]|uniref:hypothetical protein n=1 Tax=Paenibacillus silvisoli TaxID=3110539 RepID=UPI002805FE42|nr:hypothetical protein [Paenibacillus silvisoli]
MYLEKINASWAGYAAAQELEAAIRITNTAKLRGCPNMYMLEFRLGEARYHLYHELGALGYHLHLVSSEYPAVRLHEIFGGMEEDWLAMINAFMMEHYEGIQTSVDCSEGLEAAKRYILHKRLAC